MVKWERWAVCYCSWKREGGAGRRDPDPNPFPVSQAPLEHQGLSSLAWHSRGRQGRGEVAFNSIPAWENSLSCGCL